MNIEQFRDSLAQVHVAICWETCLTALSCQADGPVASPLSNGQRRLREHVLQPFCEGPLAQGLREIAALRARVWSAASAAGGLAHLPDTWDRARWTEAARSFGPVATPPRWLDLADALDPWLRGRAFGLSAATGDRPLVAAGEDVSVRRHAAPAVIGTWLRQAAAVAEFRRLSSELRRGIGSSPVTPEQREAVRQAFALRQVIARRAAPWVTLFGFAGPEDEHLPQLTLQTLDLWERTLPTNTGQRLQRVEQALATAERALVWWGRQGWAPICVADFCAELEGLAPGWPQHAQFLATLCPPLDATAPTVDVDIPMDAAGPWAECPERTGLVLWLTQTLDACQAPEQAYRVSQIAASGLLDAEGWACEIIRGLHLDPRCCDVRTRVGLDRPRICRTGVFLASQSEPTGPQDTGRIFVRPAEVELPPPGKAFRAALVGLEQWLAWQTADVELAQLRSLAGHLLARTACCGNLADWWDQLTAEQRAAKDPAVHPLSLPLDAESSPVPTDDPRVVLWQLMQRLPELYARCPTAQFRVLELLAALEAEGFRLEPAPGTPPPDAWTEPWFLATDGGHSAIGGMSEGTRSSVELVSGPAIRTPQGLFGPTVWLRLRGLVTKPSTVDAPRRLGWPVERLAVLEPLLAQLKLEDGAWEGWGRLGGPDLPYNAILALHVAEGCPDVRAFEPIATRFLNRSLEAAPPLRPIYGRLAGAILSVLSESTGETYYPRIDIGTGRLPDVPVGLGQDREAVPVDVAQWRLGSGHRPGEVLQVLRVGTRASPAQVAAAVGRDLPEPLAMWAPVFGSAPPLPELAANNPLRNWADALPALCPLKFEQITERTAACREQFRAWLDQPESEQWFHEVGRAVSLDGWDTTAGVWLQTLEQADWCRCFPRPGPPADPNLSEQLRATERDPGDGIAHWPEDAPGDGIAVSPDSARPRGFNVGPIERFSATPAKARGKFSFPLPERELTVARQLTALREQHKSIVEQQPQANQLLSAVRHCLQELQHKALVGEGLRPEPMAEVLLDALAACVTALRNTAAIEKGANLSPELSESMERSVERLRALLGVWDLVVLPESWPLPKSASVNLPSDSTENHFAFHTEVAPGNIITVRRFGIARRGESAQRPAEVLRPASVSISSGPPPAQYQRIIGILNRLAKESPELQAKDMVAQLRQWPRATQQGNLPLIALQFFELFFPEGHAQLMPTRPKLAQGLRTLVIELFRTTFRYQVIEPKTTFGYTDKQIEVVSGHNTTGTVKEVLRPLVMREPNETLATASADNTLIPALVRQ